ncbi:MAG: hypothetical protein WA908_12020, partial [Pontixanthobacter sp.]
LDNNNIAPLAAYGDYDMDRRFGRAPDGRWNNDELLPIHNARFDAMCQQVKNKNVTIWTVTFIEDQTRNMLDCATGRGRALDSDNADELITNFRLIATSIAELRLVD